MTDAVTPDNAEMLVYMLDSTFLDVHVALPAQVQAYDAATQTATVELGVRRVLQDEQGAPVTEELPVLENVPVVFQRGGGFFVSFPIAAGDTGTVMFNEASIDQWLSRSGEQVSPGDDRRHSLTGGQFIPGITPANKRLSDPGLDEDMALGKEGGVQARLRALTLEVTSSGQASAADFVAMASLVGAELSAIKAVFDAHIHVTTAVIGGGGSVGVLAPPAAGFPTPGDTSSSNLKADVPGP